jgi:RNA polymerase sigma-54 factor
MAFTTKLELRQSHSLVMTPQLQQAIKLLQLSNMELAAFVETELERNPLLEREEADETGSPLAADAPNAAANLSEGAAKEEMNGHAVDGAEVSDADLPAATRANGSTFRPTTVAGEETISIPSLRMRFPTAKATALAR